MRKLSHPHQYQIVRRYQFFDPLVQTASLSLGVLGELARPPSCLTSLTDLVLALQKNF
jgi:hypothetical protein